MSMLIVIGQTSHMAIRISITRTKSTRKSSKILRAGCRVDCNANIILTMVRFNAVMFSLFFKYLFRLLLLILVFAPIVYVAKEFVIHTKSASFSGLVVDKATGEAVANARVIVNVKEWHLNPILDTGVESFGIPADAQGRFSFKRSVEYRIRHISIEACGPSNHYGIVRIYYPYIRSAPVKVSIGPDPRVAGQPSYLYDSFTGTYGLFDLQFLGRPWPTAK